MASKRDNLKDLMRNSRSRIIIMLTAGVIIVAVILGLLSLRTQLTGRTGSAVVGGSGAARIESIPGALNPSNEYAKLVEQQNTEKAKEALSNGQSAIPTLVRSELYADGKTLRNLEGQRGVGFAALSRTQDDQNSKDVWLANLKKTGCAPAAVKEAHDHGVNAATMLQSGCTVSQLMAAGFNLATLKAEGVSAEDLRAAGFTADQLRAAGFSLAQLRQAGFSACDTKAAGYTAAEMKAAGFTDGELKGAGFDPSKIDATKGYGQYTEAQVKDMGCSSDAILKAVAAGVSPKAIRQTAGCRADEMRAAGLTAGDLRAAGFTPAEVRALGVSPEEMRAAGFTDSELKAAGFSPAVIAASRGFGSYTEAQLKGVDCSKAAIQKARAAGVTGLALNHVSGCSLKKLRDAGMTAAELKKAGFTAAELMSAGFTPNELSAAGFSAKQIAAGKLPRGFGTYTEAQIKQMGCTAQAIQKAIDAGVSPDAIMLIAQCNPSEMRAAGLTAAALRAAGVSAAQLKAAGFSAQELKEAGFEAADLIAAKYDPSDLKAAGYSAAEMLAARDVLGTGGKTGSYGSYSEGQIRQMGCSPAAIKKAIDAGVSPEAIMTLAQCAPRDLKAGGVSAAAMRAAGVSGVAMRAAGYTAGELKAGGYEASDLVAAKYSPAEMKSAGFTDDQIAAAQAFIAAGGIPPNGTSPTFGKPGGYGSYTEGQIKQMGCSPAAIKRATEAGVSPEAIMTLAQCTPRDLKAGGVTASALRAAGVSGVAMRAAGFTAAELKAGGYEASDLVAAKYSPAEMKSAGFTDEQIAAAQAFIAAGGVPPNGTSPTFVPRSAGGFGDDGVTAKALREAGYTAEQLKASGVSAVELARAGYTPAELKQIGVTARDLKAAGMSAQELAKAGFTAAELRAAGFTPDELRAAGFSEADIAAAESAAGSALASGPFGFSNGSIPGVALTPEQQQQQRMEKLLADQAKRVTAQKVQQEILQRQNTMATKANSLMAQWDVTPSQSVSRGEAPTPVGGVVGPNTGVTGGVRTGNGNGNNSANNGKDDKGPQATVILPGEVMFGVVETSINSDEPGPVLASIVGGKFSGARLVGSFSLPDKGEKVIITFNTMTLKGIDSAVSINAVAIDPFTARTALSSNTDKHILARWGGLFASSFIQGLGQALNQSDTVVTTTPTIAGPPTTTTATGKRTFHDSTKIALGTVGQSFSGILGQQFGRKPTVRVRSGVSVGILFTQEAKVPIAEITQTQMNRAFLGAMFGG